MRDATINHKSYICMMKRKRVALICLDHKQSDKDDAYVC